MISHPRPPRTGFPIRLGRERVFHEKVVVARAVLSSVADGTFGTWEGDLRQGPAAARLASLRDMRTVAVALPALAFLIAACGGGATDSPAAGPRTIEVTMKEFKFSPGTITVAPGETITLRFKNTGALEHEFMAGRGAIPSKGYTEDWIAKAGAATATHTHPGEVHAGQGVRVTADWYGTLTVVVPDEKGVYEFGCFVQGHYEAGMKGMLVVK